MKLDLPLPPSTLHAHAKGHWRGKTAATRKCRERAHAEALAKQPKPMDKGELSIVFYWPDNRRRDSLNAVQSIKPYIDGIIDARVLPDDSWQYMSIGRIVSRIDRENPRVSIEVSPT